MVTKRGLLSVMAVALAAAWLFGRLTEPTASAGSQGFVPDIAIASPAGERHLASSRGRAVLVGFFDTRWVSSRKTMRHLESLYRQYRTYGLDVMGVCTDPSWTSVGRLVPRLGITYPIGLPLRPEMAGRYLSGDVPAFILVDKRGAVRWRASGAAWLADEALADDIESLLQE